MANKFLKIENRDEWKEKLDKEVLFKTFFHLAEWEDFLEKEFKWIKFERYIWNGQVLLSLARVKIQGKEKLISHPFCEYGGPLPLVENIDGGQFQKDLFEEFKTPFKISFHPMLLPYFKGINFPESQRETYLIENINEIRVDQLGYQSGQGMDRNRKRLIKRGREYFGQAEECNNFKDLKKVYDLYVQTLKKHKVPVYPFSFFEFFFNFQNNEFAKTEILLAKDNKIRGGEIFLIYNGIIHSFLIGYFKGKSAGKDYKKSGINDFFIWSELKINKERKNICKIFDFGGTRKTSSVSEYKQRWGGKVYPIFELKNYTESEGIKKSFLRNLWGYLPVCLIKQLSPYFLKYKI